MPSKERRSLLVQVPLLRGVLVSLGKLGILILRRTVSGRMWLEWGLPKFTRRPSVPEAEIPNGMSLRRQ